MNDIMTEFEQKGFFIVRQVFSLEEIAIVKQHLKQYMARQHLGIVTEADNTTVRAVHGLHLYDGFFNSMITDPRFLKIAENILAEPCYVHQFKMNIKQAMNGQAWPWHQDFIYWQKADGIRQRKLLNIGMLIDDASMLSGPLCLIPCSHKYGELTDIHQSSSNWKQDVSKELTYQLGRERIETLISRHKEEYVVGKAGDMIVFDPMLVHSSSGNLSPHNRTFMIATYNAVSNAPSCDPANARPEFLCSRQHEPLKALSNYAYLGSTVDSST